MLESMKCPNCGFQVDHKPGSGEVFCQSCGSRLYKEDKMPGQAPPPGATDLENDLLRARQHMEMKEWETAYRILCDAIDKDADSFYAWERCLAAMTGDYTTLDLSWMPYEGLKGLASVISKSMQYATIEQKRHIEGRVITLLAPMLRAQKKYEDYQDSYEQRQKTIKAEHERYSAKIKKLFPLSIGLAGVYIFIEAFTHRGTWQVSGAVMLGILVLASCFFGSILYFLAVLPIAWLLSSRKEYQMKNDFRDWQRGQQTVDYSDKINAVQKGLTT